MLAKRTCPPRYRYRVTVSAPGSGGAAHMPRSAAPRSTPSNCATASAIATLSLNVSHSKPASSASLTDSGSTAINWQSRRAASAYSSSRRSRSAVTHTPPRGIVPDSDRPTSSSVGPISSRWSGRTLDSTPMVARTSLVWSTSCSRGWTAMHSTTSASGRYPTARATMPTCSPMSATPNRRRTGSSLASGRRNRAAVPVVFATVRSPPPRSAPAVSRVMELLPRVPLTRMRAWINSRLR